MRLPNRRRLASTNVGSPLFLVTGQSSRFRQTFLGRSIIGGEQRMADSDLLVRIVEDIIAIDDPRLQQTILP